MMQMIMKFERGVLTLSYFWRTGLRRKGVGGLEYRIYTIRDVLGCWTWRSYILLKFT